MHEEGYNFFNIGTLTNGEIMILIEAFNDEQKAKEREYRISKLKRRR